MHHWTSLWFLLQKSTPQRGKIFWLQIYPFQAILSNFGFWGQKAPPKDEGINFDFRSIHFRQFRATLVFVAEKAPPGWGKIFWHQIYPFQAISSNFGFCGRKAPPPRMRGKNWLQIYPFQAILSNFGFVAEKPPPLPRMRENFLTSDLSISGNFEQLWFCGRKLRIFCRKLWIFCRKPRIFCRKLRIYKTVDFG